MHSPLKLFIQTGAPIFLAFLLCSCQSAAPSELSLKQGVVSSASPEASAAGMESLAKGGNAADAAVAVSFALGVTEPAMSGLGGGTQILLALPGQKPIAINGSTLAPANTPVDAQRKDLKYHRRSTIPSTVKTLDFLWRKYGSGRLSWPELLAPAIRYAEEGFAPALFRHMVYKKYASKLRGSPFNAHFFLLPDGRIPGPGDVLKQPVLANTLKSLAEKGANDFYQGEIAQTIASDMAANGGWISLEDLNNFPEPKELPALQIDYRGLDVYSQPPPCGGWAVLLILNLLKQNEADLLQYGRESRIQEVVKAIHLVQEERRANPIPDLFNYQAFVQEKLADNYAQTLWKQYKSPEKSKAETSDENGETTHFSIVDRSGMALAVTASINAYFGAAAAAPDLGFLYNTYMDDFVLGRPEHPFAIRPGAMAYSSMSPSIVQDQGETVLVVGSPGSARIISSVAQLTQLWIDSDLGVQKIVDLPRIHNVRERVYFEDPGVSPAQRAVFRDQGFLIAFPTYDLQIKERNAYFGGVHAIAREHGRWVGAADPRRDGLVIKK